jgi:predicted nucleotidyltransferase
MPSAEYSIARDSELWWDGDMVTAATDGEFGALCDTARRDPAVLGVVLTGSQAREGMATRWSDHDVIVVTADGTTTRVTAGRGATLDVVVMPLAKFRIHGLPESGSDFNRYAFVHAGIVQDTPDGLIARLVARKAVLAAAEAPELAAATLDAFTNSGYRALKNRRDGRLTEARLDAAEGVPFLLAHLFAMERRVRPFNKYLGWELERHPLSSPSWRAGRLLPLLAQLLGPGWPPVLRGLFAEVERAARAAGHGPVLDAWGEDLELLRGEKPAPSSYDEIP